MTHTDYTRNILNIKDENVFFDDNCLEICKINEIETKIFHGKLTYTQNIVMSVVLSINLLMILLNGIGSITVKLK